MSIANYTGKGWQAAIMSDPEQFGRPWSDFAQIYNETHSVIYQVVNAQRMHTRVTVISLCVCVCVGVSTVYQLLTRFVLYTKHISRLYATLQRFSTYRFC